MRVLVALLSERDEDPRAETCRLLLVRLQATTQTASQFAHGIEQSPIVQSEEGLYVD